MGKKDSKYGKYICEHKRKFSTRKDAWDFILSFFKKYGIYNTPYKCGFCKQYHTTSKLRNVEPQRSLLTVLMGGLE